MDKLEIFSQVLYSPLSTEGKRVEDGILRINFAIPTAIGVGVMHSYNVGEAGQQELTKALTSGLHIAKPEDMPNA